MGMEVALNTVSRSLTPPSSQRHILLKRNQAANTVTAIYANVATACRDQASRW